MWAFGMHAGHFNCFSPIFFYLLGCNVGLLCLLQVTSIKKPKNDETLDAVKKAEIEVAVATACHCSLKCDYRLPWRG